MSALAPLASGARRCEQLMNTESYSWPRVLLHWISAAVILWVLVSGFWVSHMEVERSTFDRVAFINVAVSTLYIPLFVLRWLFRHIHHCPPSLHADWRGRLLACAVHVALYWVTALVLVSGVLMMKHEIDVFGWLTIKPLLQQPFWHEVWFDLHLISCVCLAVLLCLHIGAVLLHELAGRRVLRRMLP